MARTKDEQAIATNSIERMINTSLQLAEACLDHKDERIRELADVSIQDWYELRATVEKLWGDARNELFKRELNERT